jgi:hypothetical protein
MPTGKEQKFNRRSNKCFCNTIMFNFHIYEAVIMATNQSFMDGVHDSLLRFTRIQN